MSAEITYKCDDCGKTISWSDRSSLIEITIEKKFSDTILNREYCCECWNKRKEALLAAAK